MGCDIHFYVEANIDDQWCSADHWDDSDGFFEARIPFYEDRNYALFGELAGVRGYDQEPIDDPRGLPDDASSEVKKAAKEWGSDAHSHTWLLLEEIVGTGLPFDTLRKLEILAEAVGGPRCVRIIAWFDN